MSDFEKFPTVDCNIKLEDTTIQPKVEYQSYECSNYMNNTNEVKLENVTKIEPYEGICSMPNVVNESFFLDHFIEDGIYKEEYETSCFSMVSHILDNFVEMDTPDRSRKTIPKNILEIRKSENSRKGVFALKTIPEGVSFGPFEGLKPTQKKMGYMWKLACGKFVNTERPNTSNWMQYVNFAKHVLDQNLIIFQYNGDLYFRTQKQINIGDELLTCPEEHDENLNNEMETYCHPVIEQEMKNIYACTFCCLGFGSDGLLLDHKKNCPSSSSKNIDVEGLVQCSNCNICMGETEYLDVHTNYCQDKYIRNNNSVGEVTEELEETSIIDKKYKCEQCEYKTNSLRIFKKHTCADSQPFNCNVDGEEFSSECDQKRHILTHIEEKGNHVKRVTTTSEYKPVGNEILLVFQCSTCLKEFKDKHLLEEHSTIHVKRELLECNEDKSTCIPEENLRMHMKNEHIGGEEIFKCSKCDYQTNRKKELTRHSYRHDKSVPFECTLRKKRFTHKAGLNAHKTIHKGKIFACGYCDHRYSFRSSLIMHIKYKHDPNSIKFKCSKCPYKTAVKAYFKTHLAVHGNVKPYKCEICGKQSSTKSNLNKHMHVHDDRRLFHCKICGRQFKRKDILKTHIKVHSDRMPFQCGICGNKFKRKQNLRNHMNVHDDHTPVHCEVCGKQFKQKGFLKRHMNLHSDRTHFN